MNDPAFAKTKGQVKHMSSEDLKILIDLCEQGNADACSILGNEYYFGWTLDKDHKKALKYLTYAAEGGDADSQFLLGSMYYSGEGTEADPEKALKWFLAAAGQGNAEAMFNAGRILISGTDEEKRRLGKEWLLRSAEKGYDPAMDMLRHIGF